MYTAPAMMLLGAVLLYLAAWWYAHDGARLEAPYCPEARPSDVDAWARDLEASLVVPCPIAAYVGALDSGRTDRPMLSVYMRLGLARPSRHGTHLAAIPSG